MIPAAYRTAVMLVALLAPTAALAADHAALEPYLTPDVSSVVFLQLSRLKLPALVEELERLGVIPESERDAAKQNAADLQAAYDELPKLGAGRAYLLIRVSDFLEGGPMLVVEVAEASQAQPVADWLQARAALAASAGEVAAYLPKAFEARGKTVVGAASRERINKLLAARGDSPRQDALDALSAAGDADVAWVAFGDADTRRIVREMFPALPAPFSEIDGKLLANEVRTIGVTIKLPPEPTVTVSVFAARQQSATLLQNAATKAQTLATGLLAAELASQNETHRDRAKQMLTLLTMLTPRVEEQKLSITLGDDALEKAFLRDYVPQLARGAREDASRDLRLNRFKQITLGMLNYESSRGALPAAASYDKSGRPLLSWRVHILPFMEQGELYKQFRLDEPWDSAHNRPLVEKMPHTFADPDPAVRAAVGVGRTTFVVPTGEALLFGSREGAALRSIKDGTSNTVLFVEVVPERAVVWTQPNDWQVDARDPLAGVKRADRDWFTAGFCDGHAQIVSNTIAPQAFRGMLTPAGGEKAE